MALSGVYELFNRMWCNQSVWIYSDPHFNDSELSKGINRPTAEEQVARINKYVGKKDTLIILGDVGDIEYVRKLRGYKVLICGNHDKGATKYKRTKLRKKFSDDVYTKESVYKELRDEYPNYKITIEEDCFDLRDRPFTYLEATIDNSLFDEVYEGPLIIGEKLILSHEPLHIDGFFNIHGHDHKGHFRPDHLNVCSDVIDYTPVSMNELLKHGLLADVKTVHRTTIDIATERKKKRHHR